MALTSAILPLRRSTRKGIDVTARLPESTPAAHLGRRQMAVPDGLQQHAEMGTRRRRNRGDLAGAAGRCDAAKQTLVDIIHAIGAGPGQSLWMAWHVAPRDLVQQYDGSVAVGGCEYPDTRIEEKPDAYLTPEEISLQQQLREQFDTCPR
jgi:hypothetical protein